MNLIDYESDEELPPVPQHIYQLYKDKPHYLYIKYPLTLETQRVLKLVNNELVFDDLHISLSHNFYVPDDKHDLFKDELYTVLSRVKDVEIQFTNELITLNSITTNKQFVLVKLREDDRIIEMMAELNQLIARYDGDYIDYDPYLLHLSVSELSDTVVDNDNLQEIGSVVVDRVWLRLSRSEYMELPL